MNDVAGAARMSELGLPWTTRAGRRHRPGPGHGHAAARAVPTSTYRLQVHAGYGFDDAARQAAYLASLGVSHLYLSPVLQPAPGSAHGYDVVDHDALSAEAGGAQAFDRLVAAAHAAGLGVVVDIVPNHMTVPAAAHLNAPLWDVLRHGREARHAGWFDIDWDAEEGRLLMPVLGGPLQDVLDAGEVSIARDGGRRGTETVLRYFDHELPVRPGTEDLPLDRLLAAQAYRLADWREGASTLNYRRFFDVTSLVAVRVEDDRVFDATHALLLGLHRLGAVDGFRIDHPDGLADPAGYLARLADASDGAWVVAEKILEGEEDLPDHWRCAGTTGYDALLRVQQVLTDGSGSATLDRLWTERARAGRGGRHRRGQESGRRDHQAVDLGHVVERSKQTVIEAVLGAEVTRLVRLVTRLRPRADAVGVRRVLELLLVGMDRYRAYVLPGRPADPAQRAVLDAARARAERHVRLEDVPLLLEVTGLVSGARMEPAGTRAGDAHRELVVRFQQTCGPVMAKGIEDTAFYRWNRLSGANEVGGDPAHLAIDADGFHAFCAARLAHWPLTMTTLSTHDTKRTEDVRARLAVLAERPEQWARWLEGAGRLVPAHRGPLVDPGTEYLLWQTIIGAWPITPERLTEYAIKAVREAKVHTAWVDGDPAYEDQIRTLAGAMASDAGVAGHVRSWLEDTAVSSRANVLAQKLIQLTMPGVPDVYQGGELELLALVDPDNRRPVDFEGRAARLDRLDAGDAAEGLDDEKLLVTSRALRLRRAHPGWFVGTEAGYAAVPAASRHVLAFARGDAHGARSVTVVTRFAQRLADAGGWGEERVAVPEGPWVDVLSGAEVDVSGQGVPLRELLTGLPVALLVRAS